MKSKPSEPEKSFLFSNRFRYLLGLCLAFTLLFTVTYYSIDPDFGWHLMSGKYFIANGIPSKDIFSYTASNFSWINHEWLNDILISSIYGVGGYLGLALIFSALWTLSIHIASRLKLVSVVVLSSIAMLPYAGIRPIVWTLLFVSILELIHEKANRRLYLLIPLILLVWANLHGSFVFGLLLIAIWQIFYIKKLPWWIAVSSFLVIFINPYGWRIFIEIFATISDSKLRFRISEWRALLIPIISAPYLVWSLSLNFSIAAKPWRKLLSVPGLTLAMALSSIRHLPLFIITSSRYIEEYQLKLVKKYTKAKKPAGSVSILICGAGLASIFIFSTLIIFVSSVVNSGGRYPDRAVSFIEQNPCQGNIFNSYNYGGYLIWKLPNYKYYIDGRMPSWREGKTDYFDNFAKSLTRDEFRREEFAKYNIKCVLISRDEATKIKPRYRALVDQLQDEGWELIYQASSDNYVYLVQRDSK